MDEYSKQTAWAPTSWLYAPGYALLRAFSATVIALTCSILPTDAFSDPLGSPADLQAETSGPDAFAEFNTISEGELREMRGGMSIGGLDLSIGATIQTTINGASLQSVFKVTEAGLALESMTARGVSPGVTVLSGNGSGSGFSDVAPAGTQIAGLNENARGLAVNDSNGFSAALTQITTNQFADFVVNQANNRVIEQQLSVDVRVQNFHDIQNSARSATLVNQLMSIPNLR